MAFYLVFSEHGEEDYSVEKRDSIDEIFVILSDPKYEDMDWTIFYKNGDSILAIDDASFHKRSMSIIELALVILSVVVFITIVLLMIEG